MGCCPSLSMHNRRSAGASSLLLAAGVALRKNNEAVMENGDGKEKLLLHHSLIFPPSGTFNQTLHNQSAVERKISPRQTLHNYKIHKILCAFVDDAAIIIMIIIIAAPLPAHHKPKLAAVEAAVGGRGGGGGECAGSQSRLSVGCQAWRAHFARGRPGEM